MWGSQAEGTEDISRPTTGLQEHVGAAEHGSQSSIILRVGKGQNTNGKSYFLNPLSVEGDSYLNGEKDGKP